MGRRLLLFIRLKSILRVPRLISYSRYSLLVLGSPFHFRLYGLVRQFGEEQ